ncbi:ATP-binding protein [Hyphomicrobium sp.]|uniref:ATP-binding protein n=1 Tax=Hyphomicrobium sp. TaxID=82 RepID=UPI000FB21A35|nr:ATP-binding protein [Hyphomicrobium sp.]RUO97574.1 MAG: response regulator [Hyphomicrobium sp.]
MDDSNDLRHAFEAEEHELRLRQSKVACILGIVLIPAGIALDYITYAGQLETLAAIRLIAAGLIAVLYALHFWHRTAIYVRYLTMAGLLIAVASIAVIIGITDGANSTYYNGLFLILFAVGVLAPMQPFEAALLCISTLGIYIVACSRVPSASETMNTLLNNLYFLVLTCIISITAVHFNYRRRFNEFRLKYKLSAQHQELSALDRLKSQFFANVSHELRTPLTLILAPVEKLKSDSTHLSAASQELLEVIENNALRLLRLVNDILSLIRLEEGRAALSKKSIDMGHFLKHTVASMKHLAALKGVELNLEEPTGDLLINADPDALEKIVSNVISNAIKFTPPGGRIDVSGWNENQKVIVRISDTGIGIPAEQLPHIFDRFYQVDGSATRRHQGLGLGLALVRELITRHGGDVSATSDTGHGTTFILRLPHALEASQLDMDSEEKPDRLADDPLRTFDRMASARAILVPDAPAALPPPPTTQEPASAPEAHELPLLLIVDDEPDMRRYLASMLRENYRIIEASDGVGAVEKAREYKPDLMLLDVMLPGITGLEVCRTLKEEPATRAIKIIILTARADEDAKIIALKHGADDFLIKPFSGLEVRSRIANLIRAAQLESDLHRTNAELKQSLQQLRETEAALVQNARLSALGTMAAGLLHEIGNPLNFMGTALQLAARDPTIQSDPDTADTLKDIHAGYERIHRVVTDLRGFTAPHRPEHPRPFRIESAIDHALRFTAHVQKGITITKNIDANADVYGSQSTIAQVLVNLIVNAVAAVRTVEEERTPEIAITSKIEGNEVIVSVRDNGTGIDPKIQSQIFDPFFSTKDVGEGMGLGLAVSHRIIANHGGSLSVKSSLGEWTEFRFNLPIASEKEDQVAYGLASY